MLIDYLPLMLINMSAAFVMVALFFLYGLPREDRGGFVAGFAVTGTVALLAGLHLCLTWPLREYGGQSVRWANVAFGEPSVLLGAMLLGTSLALAKRWSLVPMGVYSLLAGVAAIAIGLALGAQGLPRKATVVAAGFVAAGAAGVLTLPILLLPRVKPLRLLGALLLLGSAALWTMTACMAYSGHVTAAFGTK